MLQEHHTEHNPAKRSNTMKQKKACHLNCCAILPGHLITKRRRSWCGCLHHRDRGPSYRGGLCGGRRRCGGRCLHCGGSSWCGGLHRGKWWERGIWRKSIRKLVITFVFPVAVTVIGPSCITCSLYG